MDGPGPLQQTRVVGGRYRLLEPLGSGGMGTVWRAEDTVLGRHVAVKEVRPPHGLSDADRATLRERTRREARAAARLDHPSAVTVYDVVEQDGEPWLVLELVEARTLADVVRTDGPLPPQRTAEVGLAVLGALEAAHRQGIVHRDVKPSNVLLGPSRVVLTDFGIATSAGDASITSTGLLLGSPSYISPERARGAAPGPASDLWALGATLFAAVEGRPPYDKGEPLPTLTAVVTDDREPYRAAGPLAPVLDGLLQPDPERRLDAEGARRLLRDVVTGPAAAAPSAQPAEPAPAAVARQAERTEAVHPLVDGGTLATHPAPVPTTRRARRRRGRLVAGAVAAALVLGGGGYAVSTLSDSGGPGTTGSTSGGGDDQGGGAAAAPAGWIAHEGGDGWTAYTPASYAESTYRGDPQYKDPESRRTLRVSTGPGRDDAVADRREAATRFAAQYPSYREVRIEPVTYRGVPGADWEFTYSDGGADLHVVDRVFVVDGTGYSLYFQVRESDWPAAREDLEQVLASFRPA